MSSLFSTNIASNVASNVLDAASNVLGVSNILEVPLNKYLDQGFLTIYLIAMTILTVAIGCYYIIRTRTLESSQCKVMTSLYGTINNSIASLNPNDSNCNYTFKDYYINTAYNCCSGGAYKGDFVDICNLKAILLQGVRCLDFEVYSLNDQPVVATSTLDIAWVKESYNSVPFQDVFNLITMYAFNRGYSPNPADPIILHFRFKSTNANMYKQLADMFMTKDSLFMGSEYSFESNGYNFGDIPLITLAGKIVVIVDKGTNDFLDIPEFYEFVNMTSSSIFMHQLTTFDVTNTPSLSELIEYNKKQMTIVIPEGTSQPANPSAITIRQTGCQMIAMRFQLNDNFLKENNEFFNSFGYAFALKPEEFRFQPLVVKTPTTQTSSVSFAPRTHSAAYYSFKV